MRPVQDRSEHPRHFSMLRTFHLADFFTLGNGCCGTAAIFFAMAHMREAAGGKVYAAGALIVLALVFDVVDGRVARWRHRASPLGRELDSLADVISFGVAPACLGYAVGPGGPWTSWSSSTSSPAGSAGWRDTTSRPRPCPRRRARSTYFEGTPIPTSVLLVLLLLALTGAGRIGDALPFGTLSIGRRRFTRSCWCSRCPDR